MADEEKSSPDENEKSEDGTEGQKKSKKTIIIAILALVLVGGGAAAFFLLGESPPESETTEESKSEETAEANPEKGKDSDAKPENEEAKESKDATKDAAKGTGDEEENESQIQFGQTYTLKPFHSNLGNPLENRYLRLEVAFEYKQGDSQKKEIEARLSQLRDAVLSVASRKTREFLLGPDGKDQLRLEILNRVNQYMDMKIESVFITDMLIE